MASPSAPAAIDASLIERVLIHGDLRQLTPAQKVSYYNAVCQSVGLNPLTQPFQYLVLNGREILYATRAATEQLRFLHQVSIDAKNFTREVIDGIYVVTAPASLPNGRTDVSTGAVSIVNVSGENRANAMMKAETKAKRRVTLSICGLGMLDETEVDSIPEAVIQLRQAPVSGPSAPAMAPATPPVATRREPSPSVPNGGDSGSSDDGPDLGVDLPPGTVRVTYVGAGKAGAKGEIGFSNTSDRYLTWEQDAVNVATQALQARTPVTVEFKTSASGNQRVHKLTPVGVESVF
jgi:hypothetical protein